MERFDGILVNLKDLEMSTTLGTLQGNEEGDVEDEEGSGGYGDGGDGDGHEKKDGC